jgi:hypothetical protein
MERLHAGLQGQKESNAMKYLALVALLALTGCAGEAIQLRNSLGQTVQCGPYSTVSVGVSVGTGRARGQHIPQSAVAAQQLRDCVYDFQRQGYERLAVGPRG